jgi:hypothetical protein
MCEKNEDSSPKYSVCSFPLYAAYSTAYLALMMPLVHIAENTLPAKWSIQNPGCSADPLKGQ